MKARVRKSGALAAARAKFRGTLTRQESSTSKKASLEILLLDEAGSTNSELTTLLADNVSQNSDNKAMFEELLKEVATLRKLRDKQDLKNGTIFQMYSYWYEQLKINEFFDILIFVYFIFKCVEAQVGETRLTDQIEFGFGVVFIVDIVMHISAVGCKAFWSSFANIFDFIIVVLTIFSFMDIVHDHNLMLLRVLRLFQTMYQIAEFRILYFATNKSLMKSAALFIGLFILNAMYSVLGVGIFGPEMDDHFGTWSKAMFTMLQVLSGDAWASNIARVAFDVSPIIAPIFFTSYVIIIAVPLPRHFEHKQ